VSWTRLRRRTYVVCRRRDRQDGGLCTPYNEHSYCTPFYPSTPRRLSDQSPQLSSAQPGQVPRARSRAAQRPPPSPCHDDVMQVTLNCACETRTTRRSHVPCIVPCIRRPLYRQTPSTHSLLYYTPLCRAGKSCSLYSDAIIRVLIQLLTTQHSKPLGVIIIF